MGTIDNGTSKVEAFATDPDIKRHLRRDASSLGITDAIMVEIPEPSVDRFDGLYLIREHAVEGRPVLGFTDLSADTLSGNMVYHACIGHKNVRILPLHNGVPGHEAIQSAHQSILRGEGVEDTLAGELIGLADPSTSGLAQRLTHSDDETRRKKCFVEARAIGYTGSDMDILQALAKGELSREVNWTGRVLPGVFCDIVHTLWDDMKYLIPGVYEYLLEQSKTRPVTLWTGGTLWSTQDMLNMMPLSDGSTGIRFKLASKYWFPGATVEEAIDDTPDELMDRYKITAQSIKRPEELR